MELTYDEVMKGFRPEFGNANHIAALPLIEKIKKLQARHADAQIGKRPPAWFVELKRLEARVVFLLRPGAEKSTYPPSFPQL